MNFAAKALLELRRYNQNKKDPWSNILEYGLKHSVKYITPPPNQLGIKVTDACIDFMRLPYPVLALEYEIVNHSDEVVFDSIPDYMRESSSKRIALAFDLESDDPACQKLVKMTGLTNGFLVTSVFYLDKSKSWAYSGGGIRFDREIAKFDLTDDMYNATAPVVSIDYRFPIDSIANDNLEEYSVLLKVLALINSKNIDEIDLKYSTIGAVKQKEMKRKNIPMFTYKTLDIFISAEKSRKLNASQITESILNFNKTKRLHSVAGHFKRRKNGLFWWNPFFRGSASKGIIKKDYNITP